MRASSPSRDGQARLQIGLDRAGEHRGRALGADGDGHRVAVDDGGGDELAVVQVVDDVDQRAVRPRDRGGAGVLGRVLVGGIEERGAGRVAGLHRAAHEAQAPLGRPALDLGRRVGGEDREVRLGLQQEPQLGQRRLAAARQDDPAAGEGQEDREMLHVARLRIAPWVVPDIEFCPGFLSSALAK